MKKVFIILILFSNLVFSQEDNLNFKMNEHLKKFEELVGNDAKIFIDFEYDFENKYFDLKENYIILNSHIETKMLKKKDNNCYMIKFIILSKDNKLILKAINFRVVKINNKKIEFNNLMNGNEYILIDN